MSINKNREKDDLLADLEASIEKALDAKLVDLAGALYRLQGSAHGWCDHADCGDCPLAPMMCVSALEERVNDLIEDHHRNKCESPSKPESLKADNINSNFGRVAQVTLRASPMSDASIKLYASRLHHQLGSSAPAYVIERIRAIDSSDHPLEAKDWQRIRMELTKVALHQKFEEPRPR